MSKRPHFTADEDNIILQEYFKNKDSMTIAEISQAASIRLKNRSPLSIAKRLYRLRFNIKNNDTVSIVRKPRPTGTTGTPGAPRKYSDDTVSELFYFVAHHPTPEITGITSILTEFSLHSDMPSGTVRNLFYTKVIPELGDPRELWDYTPKKHEKVQSKKSEDAQPTTTTQPSPVDSVTQPVISFTGSQIELPITGISIEDGKLVIKFEMPTFAQG